MRRRIAWGYSSAGRALEWHSRGQRFDPAYLHHPNGRGFRLSRFFLFMPRFARCIRRRTRWQRLPAPVPRLPPRPTRPKAARPPAKRRRSRHLCASVGMGVQRTAGSARRAVRPPSVSSPCGSSIPPAAVTPHAAKKFARRQRPFSRRYSLRAPLDDNHGSRKPDGENAGAGRRGAETPRSGRFLAPTIPAEPRFRMPVRSNAPSAKWAHTDSLSKKDTPTGKTHKALMDIWILDIKIFAPILRAKSLCFKGLFI